MAEAVGGKSEGSEYSSQDKCFSSPNHIGQVAGRDFQ